MEQPRVWPSSGPVTYPSHPPLNHDHPQPYQQTDPSVMYSSSDDTPQHQNKRQRLYTEHPEQHFSSTEMPMPSSTLPHHQGPQGNPYPPPSTSSSENASSIQPANGTPRTQGRRIKDDSYAPNAAELYSHARVEQGSPSPGPPSDSGLNTGGVGGNHYPSDNANSVPRLPPILQVEKQQVTTSATQQASSSRRRNEAHFVCPVPGCGSTFTRRFNLRGHLRSHTEERPYVCEVCKKGFARQHDCKRHQALHATAVKGNICQGCKKPFSRLDALNRHLRSEGGAECRHLIGDRVAGANRQKSISGEDSDARSNRTG